VVRAATALRTLRPPGRRRAAELEQGLARSKPGFGTLALRGLEVAAATLVLAFDALLLTGYMVGERLMGV
jgi:hypothetical protein